MDCTPAQQPPQRNTFFGTEQLNVPRSNCEIETYMKDCMIENWDHFEAMLDYIYKDCLRADSKNHGVLFSEATVSLLSSDSACFLF